MGPPINASIPQTVVSDEYVYDDRGLDKRWRQMDKFKCQVLLIIHERCVRV